jgi:hypothetical protein
LSPDEPADADADVVAPDPPTGTVRVRGATLFVLGLVGLTAILALVRTCGTGP